MEEEKNIDTTSYNRKNVDKIKKFLVVVFLIMFALPILICLYLMVRMNSLERKIDNIAYQLAGKKQVEDIVVKEPETIDYKASDITAYEALEKNTTQELPTLAATVSDAVKSGHTNSDASAEDNDGLADEISDEAITPLNGKKVYLTFDDGPCIYTDEILDILKEEQVKATFFVVHRKEEELWPIYNRIVDEGHTLAMHSFSHEYNKVYADEAAFKRDVKMIHDFLYAKTGYDCKYYRFPGGSSNQVSDIDMQNCMKYLDDEGYVYFDWNALSRDAEVDGLSPEALNSNVINYVNSNEGDSIVLMHDVKPGTAAGLKALIEELKAEGYEICAIDDNTALVQHVSYDPE